MKTAKEWLIKPQGKGITDEDWIVYLHVGILGSLPDPYVIPIGMKMFEIYQKVDKIVNPPKPPELKPTPDMKGWPSCIKRNYSYLGEVNDL